MGAYKCHSQGTLLIDFDGPPVIPVGSAQLTQRYDEAGMSFAPIGATGFVRQGGGVTFYPQNGTTYLQAGLGSTLMFGFTNGSVFDLAAVDLAEYSTVVPNAVTVQFVGHKVDGSTVMANLTTDGIIDGTGPLADFQTFNFGPEFSNLTRVEIPTFGWSLDNLVVSIPEPGTWALLLTGGLFLGALKFRRRIGG
jgi:hypothetical protein